MLGNVCDNLSHGDQVYDIIHYCIMNTSAIFSMEYEVFNDTLKIKPCKMPNASFSLFGLHWNALGPNTCNLASADSIIFISI